MYEDLLEKTNEINALKDEDTAAAKSGIADIIRGLSDCKIDADWGYDENYYTNARIENEAFANFFEAGMSYKPLKEMYIREVFPNAYERFNECLKQNWNRRST